MNSTTMETVRDYPHLESLIPAHWQEQTVPANGLQQHIYRTGKGDTDANTLVLLHGIMVDATGWIRTADALEDQYDVIMPDARFHGRSTGGGAFSLAQLGADVIALIEALGRGKVALLGHSMGAGTAAHVAATRPDLVSQLILEEPALRAAPDMRTINPEWYNAWIASLRTLKTVSHGERMAAAGQMMPQAGAWHPADLVPWVDGMAAFNLCVLDSEADVYTLPPWGELIPRIECPLLLLTGDPARGSTSTPEALQAFTGMWRNGQHQQLDGGHVLHAEAFEEFIEAVQKFL